MIYSQTGVRLREYDIASGRFAISNMGKRSRRFFRYAKKMVHIREVRYRGGIPEWLIWLQGAKTRLPNTAEVIIRIK